jgi:hypothetical protein
MIIEIKREKWDVVIHIEPESTKDSELLADLWNNYEQSNGKVDVDSMLYYTEIRFK